MARCSQVVAYRCGSHQSRYVLWARTLLFASLAFVLAFSFCCSLLHDAHGCRRVCCACRTALLIAAAIQRFTRISCHILTKCSRSFCPGPLPRCRNCLQISRVDYSDLSRRASVRFISWAVLSRNVFQRAIGQSTLHGERGLYGAEILHKFLHEKFHRGFQSL